MNTLKDQGIIDHRVFAMIHGRQYQESSLLIGSLPYHITRTLNWHNLTNSLYWTVRMHSVYVGHHRVKPLRAQ